MTDTNKSNSLSGQCPAEFRMDRENYLHFSFGIHNCPGAPLARMEMKVALQELLQTFPDFAVAGPMPDYVLGGGDDNCLPSLMAEFSPAP